MKRLLKIYVEFFSEPFILPALIICSYQHLDKMPDKILGWLSRLIDPLKNNYPNLMTGIFILFFIPGILIFLYIILSYVILVLSVTFWSFPISIICYFIAIAIKKIAIREDD